MKGYKIFQKAPNNKLRCRNFLFSENKINIISNDIKLCENGFHFCVDLNDCFRYYEIGMMQELVVCEIEANGDIDGNAESDKKACSHLEILSRLNINQIFDLLNDVNKIKLLNVLEDLGDIELDFLKNVDIDLLEKYYDIDMSNDLIVDIIISKLNRSNVKLISKLVKNHISVPDFLLTAELGIYTPILIPYYVNNFENGKDVIVFFKSTANFKVIEDNWHLINNEVYANFLIKSLYIADINDIEKTIPRLCELTSDITSLVTLYNQCNNYKLDRKIVLDKIIKTINNGSVLKEKLKNEDLSYILKYTVDSHTSAAYLIENSNNIKVEDKLAIIKNIKNEDILYYMCRSNIVFESEIYILIENLKKTVRFENTEYVMLFVEMYPQYKEIINDILYSDVNFHKNIIYKWICKYDYFELYKNSLDLADLYNILATGKLSDDVVLKITDSINESDLSIHGYSMSIYNNYIDYLSDRSINNIYSSFSVYTKLYSYTTKHKKLIIEKILKQCNVHIHDIAYICRKHVLDYPDDSVRIYEISLKYCPLINYILYGTMTKELVDNISDEYTAKIVLNYMKDSDKHLIKILHRKFFLKR